MPLPPSQSVFRLVLARPARTSTGEHATLVHLAWFEQDNALADRVVQVYLNGKLYTAIPANMHELWLTVPRDRPHTIELLAVDPQDVARPFAEALHSWSPRFDPAPAFRADRDPNAPPHATVTLQDDDESTLAVEPLWPADVPRPGFGVLFGEGPFGTDAASSPGLGLGALGHGPLDADAPPITLQPHLDSGSHTLTLTASHQPDQPTPQTLTVSSPTHLSD